MSDRSGFGKGFFGDDCAILFFIILFLLLFVDGGKFFGPFGYKE